VLAVAMVAVFGTMAADVLHVGFGVPYLVSTTFFAVVLAAVFAVLAVPAVGYRWFGLNPILAFWFVYIITRPLGASFADWVGVSHVRGGLDLGTAPVSLVLALVIVGLVVYMTATSREAPPSGRTGT
jgi:uncharacterized membrane-anchored protein